MKNREIVLVSSQKTLRGGEFQLILLAKGLRKRDFNLSIIYNKKNVKLANSLCNFDLFPINIHSEFDILAARRVARICSGKQVVIANDSLAQSLVFLGRKRILASLVAIRRVGFPIGKSGFRLRKYLTFDRIIAISDYVRQMLVKSGVPPAKIVKIYSMIESVSPVSPQKRNTARNCLGIPAKAFVVGTLTNFSPEKRVEDFLLAMNSLPRCLAVLSGEGRLKPYFIGYCRKIGIRNRVIFAPRDEQFLDAFDLFVYPSQMEGLGTAPLLALSRGIPVISTDAGGLPEVVIDGVNGFLLPVGSPDRIAGRIIELMENRKLYDKFSKHSIEYAQNFVQNRVLNEYETVLNSL
ncbi:MAG: hypothetical protein B6D65_02080 [candidate division Zixibacteria bacterium 4484_93]|nr:MAG: hypothetical protein B6D65_02080 [candidate division Zixibacteria bacterium 4484_93]